MKKIVSLGLAALMAMSVLPVAYAGNVYNSENPDEKASTQVTYNAADPDGDGVENVNNEQYTVTVPAKLIPNGTAPVAGDVVAEGTWASNRKLVVNLKESSVVLTNNLSADTKTLALDFDGIELLGNNTEAVSASAEVSVAPITDALFGTWSGTFEYVVTMEDVA